jgi:hypothetical protein
MNRPVRLEEERQAQLVYRPQADTIWEFEKPKKNADHPTMKRLRCWHIRL